MRIQGVSSTSHWPEGPSGKLTPKEEAETQLYWIQDECDRKVISLDEAIRRLKEYRIKIEASTELSPEDKTSCLGLADHLLKYDCDQLAHDLSNQIDAILKSSDSYEKKLDQLNGILEMMHRATLDNKELVEKTNSAIDTVKRDMGVALEKQIDDIVHSSALSPYEKWQVISAFRKEIEKKPLLADDKNRLLTKIDKTMAEGGEIREALVREVEQKALDIQNDSKKDALTKLDELVALRKKNGDMKDLPQDLRVWLNAQVDGSIGEVGYHMLPDEIKKTADEIVKDPDLTKEEKLEKLQALKQRLQKSGYPIDVSQPVATVQEAIDRLH